MILALFGNDWSSSHPNRFTRKEGSSPYASDRRLSGLGSRYGRCGKEKSLILLDIEPPFPDCPAHSLITVVNELNKLLCVTCRCYDMKEYCRVEETGRKSGTSLRFEPWTWLL
jgi:hypothetical protein